MAITPDQARAELRRRDAVAELQRRDAVALLGRSSAAADPKNVPSPEYREPGPETPKVATKPEALRPGLVHRLAADVWNAGPAAVVNAVRTNPEGLGGMARDAEILHQYRLARETGEIPEKTGKDQDETVYAEMTKRADAVLAERNKKPFLLGGAAGQVLAGNQIPLPPATGPVEKAVDVVGGVGGAVANIALTRRVMPTAPEALVLETATEAAGGTPGTGAAMAGIMSGAGKIVGKSPVSEGIGKRVLRRVEKAGIESLGFGGLAVAEGASPEEIATQMLLPWAFGAMGAVKELPVEARRQKSIALLNRIAELDKTIPLEAVKVAEKLVKSGAYDTTPADTSSVGANAGPTFKPHGRVQAEIGREIVPTAGRPTVEPKPKEPVPSGMNQEQFGEWLYSADRRGFGKAKSLGFADQWQYYQKNYQNRGFDNRGITPQETPKGASQGPLPVSGETQPRPATVKMMLTQADRQTLRGLGYTDEQIGKLTPEEGGRILDNRVSQTPTVVSDNAPPVEPPATEKSTRIPGTISNAATGELRGGANLPPVTKRPAQSEAEWIQKAIDQGLNNPRNAVARAIEIIENPVPLTEAESAGFGIVLNDANKQYRMAEQITAELPDSDPRFAAAAKQGLLAADTIDKITQATTAAGSPGGGSQRARQMVLGELTDNTSVPSVLSRARIEKGRGLTPAEETKATETVHEFKAAQDRADKVQRIASKRQAGKILRSSRKKGSRYDRMTEADKDAELQDLLREAGEVPDAATLYNMAMNLGSRPGVRTIGDIATRLQEHFPSMNEFSLSDALVEAMERKVRETSQTEQVLKTIRKEARGNKTLRTLTDDALYRIKGGEGPEDKRSLRKPDTDTIQALKEVRDFYTKAMTNSEPVQQAKMQRRIDFLNARIAAGDFLPKSKQVAYEPSQRVLEMQYEAARLNGEIRRQISQQKPRSALSVAAEPLRIVMALKSSFDLSGLGNQGGWALLSHPLRTLRRVPEALNAFASEKETWIINERIRKRANASLYFRDKLEIVEATGHAAFTHGEEQYRSNLAEYIPGIKASNRSFATLLNLIRADSYDSLARFFSEAGGPTKVEGLAIADFVNMMTGRGNVRGHEQTIAAVNGLFWAPRRTISRFQVLTTLGGTLEWGRPSQPGQWRYSPIHLRGTGTTRKLFAGEIGRYMAGLATVYTLGALAGGELEGDPRSTDFGKIKFGNARIDPLSGLSQTLVFISRFATRSTKTAEGDIVPLIGEDLPYTARKLGDVGLDFLSGKVTPGLGVGWSILSGETRFDGPTTPWSVLKDSLVPIAWGDVYKSLVDQGVTRGTALAMLGLLGVGVQVYGDELTRAEYKEYYK
jgi:hypothetical protein